MKNFWIILLSLLCLTGGLYAQEEETVNDTVYFMIDGEYAEMTISLSQIPSTWSLYVDWGNGRMEKFGDGVRWPEYLTGEILYHYYDEPGKYQIKLFSESGDIKSKLFGLDLRRRIFTSLDVRGCVALQYLSCADNQLTSLDVSGCTVLTSLNCNSNQLTSLNLSGCMALDTLICYSNQLTSLDVSGCTALTSLNCNSNQLTSLNLSGCMALDTLICYSNQLTSLDVSKNVALTHFDCGYNQLASLDVSKNVALTHFDCGYNQLASLDVSQNIALEYLNCYRNQLASLDVSQNIALEYLNCEWNQLQTLDVSNTALEYLDCSHNQLQTLDVSQNSALTNLDCAENQLQILDVSQNTVLEYLDCGYNELIQFDLSENTALRSLSCYGNRRAVVLDELGRFDLSTLIGFDVDKAEDWQNGVLSGNMLEFQQGRVRYDYPTNNPRYAFVHFSLLDNSPVAMPEIYVMPGIGTMDRKISLGTMTPDATIFYTIDGSEPTEFSQQYETEIEVKSSPLTIKAIAVKDGMKSRVSTATFEFPWLPNEAALSATTLRVYASDKTIYLSEPCGQVEVFTLSGRRVYRGVSTAIPVPRPGVYIVTAAGQKYKIGVK